MHPEKFGCHDYKASTLETGWVESSKIMAKSSRSLLMTRCLMPWNMTSLRQTIRSSS